MTKMISQALWTHWVIVNILTEILFVILKGPFIDCDMQKEEPLYRVLSLKELV